MGRMIAFLSAVVLFFAVIRHDSAMLALFYQTGGWSEAWTLPLMVLPIVFTLGSIGGIIGRYA